MCADLAVSYRHKKTKMPYENLIRTVQLSRDVQTPSPRIMFRYIGRDLQHP